MINDNDFHQALRGTACIITGGLFDTIHAKTTHGLLRESNRFKIKCIVDDKFAGHSVEDVVLGLVSSVPIYSSIASMCEAGIKPDYAIIGMATKGGVLPQSLYHVILEALSSGINIVNGLHQPLSEVEELKSAAQEHEVHIYDIRKPKKFDQLHFWSGKIMQVKALKLAILGTDCSVGKRTTAKLLTNALNQAGIKTQMIYTGQTGWLQGTKYGLIFDATPNDFIPGEIEHAIYQCWTEEKPQVIIVEGQASLLNPGGPCGSEFIISAKLDGVILQHHPTRIKYHNLEKLQDRIKNPSTDIEIIRLMGSEVWALVLNIADMSQTEIAHHTDQLTERCSIPVVSPLTQGIQPLVNLINSKLSLEKVEIS